MPTLSRWAPCDHANDHSFATFWASLMHSPLNKVFFFPLIRECTSVTWWSHTTRSKSTHHKNSSEVHVASSTHEKGDPCHLDQKKNKQTRCIYLSHHWATGCQRVEYHYWSSKTTDAPTMTHRACVFHNTKLQSFREFYSMTNSWTCFPRSYLSYRSQNRGRWPRGLKVVQLFECSRVPFGGKSENTCGRASSHCHTSNDHHHSSFWLNRSLSCVHCWKSIQVGVQAAPATVYTNFSDSLFFTGFHEFDSYQLLGVRSYFWTHHNLIPFLRKKGGGHVANSSLASDLLFISIPIVWPGCQQNDRRTFKKERAANGLLGCVVREGLIFTTNMVFIYAYGHPV